MTYDDFRTALPIRARKVLVKLGVDSFTRLAAVTEQDVLNVKNAGRITARHISEALEAVGRAPLSRAGRRTGVALPLRVIMAACEVADACEGADFDDIGFGRGETGERIKRLVAAVKDWRQG